MTLAHGAASLKSSERKERARKERRQEILDAARDVFTEKGFSGATMEEIAERADYSQAALYLYFKNKYEIYTTLTHTVLERLAVRFEELDRRAELGPLEKLQKAADVLCEVYEYDPGTMVNLFRLQASRGLRDMPPEMVERLNGVSARIMRLLAGIFREGMERGVFRPFNTMALADSVWAVFTGMVLWEESKRFFDPRKQYLRPTLEVALGLLLDGLTLNCHREKE